ncbi:MAG: universal stress protein, partial [Gemmataceae bacterium]
MSAGTILHPTDFSASSDHALGLARVLAQASGCRLLVVHVAPLFRINTTINYRKKMKAALRRRGAFNSAIETDWKLLVGEAAPEILELAQVIRCSRIVMGSKGLTGLARLLMGSVAEKVVRNASCPVVTVKAPQGQSEAERKPTAAASRTILHPTDFSRRCAEAFRVACSLAKGYAARVIVVHVPEPRVASSGMAPSPPLPDGHWGGLEERLRRFHSSVPDVRVEYRIEEGEAAAGIVSAAQATN